MVISFDWFWTPELDCRSRVRVIYRDNRQIGRVRRWKGDRVSDWFTAELMTGSQYEPIEGKHATFKAALKRVVMNGDAL